MYILPYEIINKILAFRVAHPIATMLKPLIGTFNEYNENRDDTDSPTFFYYLMHILEDPRHDYYFEKFNLKVRIKNKEGRLRCFQCGYWFELYDIYYINTNIKSVFCISC